MGCPNRAASGPLNGRTAGRPGLIKATVLQRIGDRAARDGDDFKLSTELAASYFDHFKVPTAAEGPLTVITNS